MGISLKSIIMLIGLHANNITNKWWIIDKSTIEFSKFLVITMLGL